MTLTKANDYALEKLQITRFKGASVRLDISEENHEAFIKHHKDFFADI